MPSLKRLAEYLVIWVPLLLFLAGFAVLWTTRAGEWARAGTSGQIQGGS